MNKKVWRYIFLSLLMCFVLVWTATLSIWNNNLKIVACDVGQGDAILVQKKSTQILIDGGPNNSVLECLSRHMPFWDRTIDLVILTHPQEDHYGGLIDVFGVYNVNNYLASELESQNIGYLELTGNIDDSNILIAKKGLYLKIGDIYIKTLHPASVIPGSDPGSSDPNDFSIVNEIAFSEFKMLLTGDIGPEVIDEILSKNIIDDINVLKVPHHGSKNGLTVELLTRVKPEVAIISAGSKNRFGHPHKEILKMLEGSEIIVHRTDLEGDVVITTNGVEYWH